MCKYIERPTSSRELAQYYADDQDTAIPPLITDRNEPVSIEYQAHFLVLAYALQHDPAAPQLSRAALTVAQHLLLCHCR